MTELTELPAATLPQAGKAGAQAAGENFPVATRLLPRAERRHLMALYGFARFVDDLGDELEAPAEGRLAALDAAESELDRAFSGDRTQTHPVFVRLAETVEERSLPRRPFADLIEANRVDQRIAHYETYEDLLDYCRLSAVPIGRLVLAVFGQETPERVMLSDDICVGLQLIEHWQDVVEDAGKGRCYLPLEDLRRFGVPTGDDGPIALGQLPDPAFTRLIAFETSRAADLVTSGAPLVAGLKGWARLAVAGFVGGGLAQTEAMGRAGYDVISRTVKASKGAVAVESARVLWRAATGQK